MTGRGLGPWFTTLYFNLNGSGKTELRVHGANQIFAAVLNVLDMRDYWASIMEIGPFNDLSKAMTFHRLWAKQLRGKAKRLKRGITLWNAYGKKYNLHVWIQTETIDDIKKNVDEMRQQHTFSQGFTIKIGKRQRIRRLLKSRNAIQQTFGGSCNDEITLQNIRIMKKQRMK